ncbi:hypothetical protein HRE42_07745 [Enterococcus faecalis]|uniref:hypothetical protein n=1 Tax=Enterococcus faecalis TaxID=1351 RepID=UPI001573E62C|nr:hypothetical protein [Enterococcus faecalis]NSN47715.1 hypothetical protein [Enterococcus faecalis]HAP5384227.1 hypothetical protein [Enterococcus faecalis]HCT4218575.1 hypothetical protein [Enterococcus faecalis]HCY8954660.1 hypothetical protein [Enterococcus faecalis]HCY9017568.1 hypothetical protein [Enterococcus faecalis]
MDIDFMVLMPAVTAVIAIIAPVITTFVNNKHLEKLKKLELEQESFKIINLHKRQIFDHYLSIIGEFSYESTKYEISELTKAYYAVLPYIPTNVQNDFREFSEYIGKQDFSDIGSPDSERMQKILHDTIIPTFKSEIEK